MQDNVIQELPIEEPSEQSTAPTAKQKKTKGLNISANVLSAISLVGVIVALVFLFATGFRSASDLGSAIALVIILVIDLYASAIGTLLSVVAIILSAVSLKRKKTVYALVLLLASVFEIVLYAAVLTALFILAN